MRERAFHAVHNLTASNLLFADKMGGIAAPSFAILPKGLAFENFGEITLLPREDVWNPRLSSAAKVFAADVYSCRYPSVTYAVAESGFNLLRERLLPYMTAYGIDRVDCDEIRRRGPEHLYQWLPVIAAFLDQKGHDISPVMREVKEERWMTDDRFKPHFDRDVFDLRSAPEFRALAEKYIREELDDTVEQLSRLDGDLAQGARSVIDIEAVRAHFEKIKFRDGQLNERIFSDFCYQISRATALMTPQVEEYATRNRFNEVCRDKRLGGELDLFCNDLMSAMKPVEKIFVGYRADGYRKYVPHTLSNAVKIMKAQIRGGEDFNYGLGTLRSHFAPALTSFSKIEDEIHRVVPSAEFEEEKKHMEKRMLELVGQIGAYSDHPSSYQRTETVLAMIEEIGKGRAAERVFRDYHYSDVPDEVVDEIKGFVRDLRAMKTEYFECKVVRAVELSEFFAAIVPTDLDDRVRSVLNRHGIEVVSYEREIEGDRAQKLESLLGGALRPTV